MPIRRYLENGVAFTPEALSAMGRLGSPLRANDALDKLPGRLAP